MFAPPPLQLTRAEIARLKLERQARLAEAEEACDGSSSTTTSSPRFAPSPFRHRIEWHWRDFSVKGHFARDSKFKVSKSISPPTLNRPQTPEQRHPEKKAEVPNGERSDVSPAAEQHSETAVSPSQERPPWRRGIEHFLRPLPSAYAVFSKKTRPHCTLTPSSVPDIYPKRPPNALQGPESFRYDQLTLGLPVKGMSDVFEQPSTNNPFPCGLEERQARSRRMSIGPAVVEPRDRAGGTFTPSREGTYIPTISRRPKDLDYHKRLSGVHRSTSERATCTATQELDGLRGNTAKRETENTTKTVRLNRLSSDAELSWQRCHRLPEAGCFLQTEPAADTTNHLMRASPPLSLIHKKLPATPDSMMQTPAELYRNKSRGKQGTNARKCVPLVPLATMEPKARHEQAARDISPIQVPAEAELTHSAENSPPSSRMATPVANQIQLRDGPTMTISLPELTAWQPLVFMQAPLELAEAMAMPRKISAPPVRPVGAFRDVVDQAYPDALASPHYSDDAIEDDICEWVDGFGFEDISFPDDMLTLDDLTVDDVSEIESADDPGNPETGPVATPATGLDSPTERVVGRKTI